MAIPPLKLSDSEQGRLEVLCLRRKGIFGNRYGSLVITNQRIAFVKAVMQGVGAMLTRNGVNAMLTFDPAKTTGTHEQKGKRHILVLSHDGVSERFVMLPEEVDKVLAQLQVPQTGAQEPQRS